jgi:hypothetical protein
MQRKKNKINETKTFNKNLSHSHTFRAKIDLRAKISYLPPYSIRMFPKLRSLLIYSI